MGFEPPDADPKTDVTEPPEPVSAGSRLERVAVGRETGRHVPPSAGGFCMDSTITLEQWHHGLRIFHRAHARAATMYERRSMALGLPAVILTAVAGTTVFATITSSPDPWVKVLTGVMSMAAAVLAALQTFLRYSELAERHKTASQNYGMLRREWEEMGIESASSTPPAPPSAAFLKSFRERWDAVDQQSPNLPQNVYDSVEKQLATAKDGQ